MGQLWREASHIAIQPGTCSRTEGVHRIRRNPRTHAPEGRESQQTLRSPANTKAPRVEEPSRAVECVLLRSCYRFVVDKYVLICGWVNSTRPNNSSNTLSSASCRNKLNLIRERFVNHFNAFKSTARRNQGVSF